MEKRDLYNKNRILTGETILKDEDIPEDRYILVVVLLIENSQGELLIQKRSEAKGGKWAFTGVHPKTGESSITGIKTEVKEELGIDILTPILFKQASGKNTFCDLYYIKQDIDLKDIVMQTSEVADVKYESIDGINNLYDNGEFKKGHYQMFKDYLNYVKQSKISS